MRDPEMGERCFTETQRSESVRQNNRTNCSRFTMSQPESSTRFFNKVVSTSTCFFSVCLVVSWLLVVGCVDGTGAAQPETVGFVGLTMGTTYSVKLARAPRGHTLKEVHQQVERMLRHVDGLMSTYKKDSDVSRFSRSRSTDWFSVSSETATVVAEAQRISRLSGGAFDVTVAPLVNLWHFGPEEPTRKIPTEKEIQAAKEHVGYRHLHVRLDPPALKKDIPTLSVDLSAIAKGYAVDRVAELLESLGIDSYLVEVGGETRTHGCKADGSPWRIGVEKPDTLNLSGTTVVKILEPGDKAVATSGDYRNFFVVGGKRYSHEIDPRTGRPVQWSLASVTVVADSCMTADAFATALMVLGPSEGYNLAVAQKLAVLMIVREADGYKEKKTPEFVKLFGNDP